ncbi:MAG: iron-containing alcohol dehydrogenase, partial [Bacteroidales bacterium]|nr:iron-containing alcohol dehydrogenase [Bacteroidales bacterium]
AVHGFASSAGGMFSIPHGVLCGTIMAVANKVTVRALRSRNTNNQTLAKYARLGRLFSETSDKSDDYYTDAFVDYLLQLTERFKLPLLREYGISEKDLLLICEITDVKNNPVKLEREELMEILKERL